MYSIYSGIFRSTKTGRIIRAWSAANADYRFFQREYAPDVPRLPKMCTLP